jgi:polyhydroxybutyrate depolymerase
MRTLRFLALFLLVAPAILYMTYRLRADSRDARESITVDGLERTYRLHVPSTYDSSKPVPLVLALHGRLGTGEGQERLSHFDKISDEHGFLVVYPDGLDRSWADGRGKTPSDEKGVSDVKFLSELIQRLESQYKVDAARVYATGMSNGGFMSGRLACDLSDKIAAVGIVAASLSTNTAASCKPLKPVSVLIIQGTEDPLVPFQGGALGKNGDRGEVLSHDAAVKKFVALNRCSASPQTQHLPDTANDGTSTNLAIYEGCSAGTQVRSYTVEGAGHTWPGGMQYLPSALIGKTSHNFDASEAIWEFFAAHPR